MLLLLLFGMALAWFLQKKLYQKNWQKNLKIQVSFQDSAIYEGEESTLKEVVVNDKLLPIPALELGISMSRNLEFDREAKANASITDQSYKRDVFSFLFHQQVTRTLPFQAKKRGFYEITGAHAVAYDLFFRCVLRSKAAVQVNIAPTTTPIKRFFILFVIIIITSYSALSVYF